jgi:hypothetical protein
MKKLFALGVLACALAAATVVPSALAASCTPTDYFKDGHFLTAAVNDTGVAVSGPVDATGCDIGVYVKTMSSTISSANIFGATYYGVLVNGGAATIAGSSVHDIGDVPLSGVQHGVGVSYVNGATGSISSTSIYRYQKNGTAFDGAGTNVSITNSTVTGEGKISYTAQNGIQFSRGAAGVARGNTVTGNWYTGCSNQDAAKTGCVPYFASAILLYDVDAKSVDTSKNVYRDDQKNLVVLTSASLG